MTLQDEVHAFVESRSGDPTGTRAQVECPICGSDTAFSIVTAEGEPSGADGRPASVGDWSCLSSKHPGVPHGTWARLKRLMNGGDPLSEGVPAAPRQKRHVAPARRAKRGTVATPLGADAERSLADWVEALQKSRVALDWLADRYRMTPEQARSLRIGLRALDKQVKVEGEWRACREWLVWPYTEGGQVYLFKHRTGPEFEQAHKHREFFLTGNTASDIPYNIDAADRFIASGMRDSMLLVVEGESDCWTVRRLLGDDEFVVGVPGEKRLTGGLGDRLRTIGEACKADDQPKVLVIPDKDAYGLVERVEQAVGSRLVRYVELPFTDRSKDLTDMVVKEGWSAAEIEDALVNGQLRPRMRGAVTVGAAAAMRASMKEIDEENLRFHIPDVDRLLETPMYKHPVLPGGQFSILVGPRKHGKSRLAMRAGMLSAMQGVPGLICSREMGLFQTLELLYKELFHRVPTCHTDWQNFASRIGSHGLCIESDSQEGSIKAWVDLVMAGTADHGWRWVIFDSLSYVAGASDESQGTATDWCRTLKDVAKRTGVHVMTLAHVTPGERNENYHHPLGANSIRRYKDALQYADKVFCMQRKEFPPHGAGFGVLFQKQLDRTGQSGGSKELYWKGLRPPEYRRGAFFGETEEDVAAAAQEDPSRPDVGEAPF